MNLLQKIIMPSMGLNSCLETYIRSSEGVLFSRRESMVEMSKGSNLSLNTFYNSLDVRLWRKECKINKLYVKLFGKGLVRVKCFYARSGLDHVCLGEWQYDLAAGKEIAVNNFENITTITGKIYIELTALEDSVFKGGAFLTDAEPINDVSMGIVITHFNRKKYVIPAIKRIEEQLLNDEDIRSKIRLVVVDNSNNLSIEEVGPAKLIPNKNLGGSGGFTRGLLDLKKQGFSHCLFMDDDGSCEIECIRRTFVILTYSTADNLAISGVLLPENSSYLIHEKGGYFDLYGGRSNKHGVSAKSFEELLSTDDGFECINYGAWCFFAFPIKDVRKLPFPFFVRGDDILFSLQNNFKIISPCGVSVYIDEFEPKEGPLVKYLGARSVFFISTVISENCLLAQLKLFSKWYLASLFSYQYDSAKAIDLALRDLLSGGKIFIEDADGSNRRQLIKGMVEYEDLTDAIPLGVVNYPDMNEGKFRKALRYLTLNGLLLPGFLLRDGVVLQKRGWRGVFRQIFGYKRIFYYSPIDGKGYVTRHCKRELLIGTYRWFKNCLLLVIKHRAIQTELKRLCEYATTEDFWRSRF